ncbi:bifunctional DNA primase/polymerase [Streptomyces sp. NPDC088560]|uniref:bifunctional DNA primase/polymerase n=1 Tax=Streptomyces sp. NPDC088560 TaxID=3365868 RepID=UPI003823DAA0
MSVEPLAVARWCAVQGWPVHPLVPGRKTPVANCRACVVGRHRPAQCPCIPEGRPCHGFHAATTDVHLVEKWWGNTPNSGVGVACGPAGLIVIDIDAHQVAVAERAKLLPGVHIPDGVELAGLASGFDTLALLAAYRGEDDPAKDASTLRVRTPSGGLHIWYRNPDTSRRYRCSTGSGRRAALAWQVDVRADGGYIVAPGTRTLQGVYMPEGKTRVPAVLPDWLGCELQRTGHVVEGQGTVAPLGRTVLLPPRLQGTRSNAGEEVINPLIVLIGECGVATEGTGFTEKLNKAAYTAGGLVGAGYLEHGDIRERLVRVAYHVRPWQQSRNEKIVDDALAAGFVHPLHLKGRP